ncbi:glycosyltransferase family A protein [Pontibacter locisalis]|uniref:Glycosyltransferase family A protein n=1 Tax=Pontibacter locisalis TaxID=1719035 RepID=A0ABW5IGQ3_9BACT
MKPRIPDASPLILPLSNDIDRSLWFEIIPSYNCINTLKQALESVLIQDLGPEKIQIEVVDDCSTDGVVKELV